MANSISISFMSKTSSSISAMDRARRELGYTDGKLYSVVIRNGRARYIDKSDIRDTDDELKCDLPVGKAQALVLLVNTYNKEEGMRRYSILRDEYDKEHNTEEKIVSEDKIMIDKAKHDAQEARNLRQFAESKAEDKRKQIEELKRQLAAKKAAEEEKARKAEEERKAKRDAEIAERDRQIAEYAKKQQEEEALRAEVLKQSEALDDEIARLMEELNS